MQLGKCDDDTNFDAHPICVAPKAQSCPLDCDGLHDNISNSLQRDTASAAGEGAGLPKYYPTPDHPPRFGGSRRIANWPPSILQQSAAT